MSDVSDDDYPTTLEEAARSEQGYLWDDLGQAIGRARNGVWSMECDRLASRIVGLARLVGSTPWGAVPMSLIQSGVYERVLDAAGLAYEPISRAEVAEYEAEMARHPFVRREA